MSEMSQQSNFRNRAVVEKAVVGQRLIVTCDLSRDTHIPALTPGLAVGASFLFGRCWCGVLGINPCMLQRVLKSPMCGESSGDLLPLSPPADKAIARQDHAGQARDMFSATT